MYWDSSIRSRYRIWQNDPALTTEQLEQDSDPVTPCHAGVDREVIAKRTA
jgi:hypothetical protein